ncbi:MAG: aa3-type cytochrome oxidase subunit CtaJ [Mycobacteriales bacterium]
MSRAVTRAATAGLTGLVTVLLTAAPAFATDPLGPAEGADPGKGLSTGATLLLYVGIPVTAFVLIGLVVWLPGAVRANRYRPNKGWNASPVWFAGPPEPVAAVQSADRGDVVRGGASGSW